MSVKDTLVSEILDFWFGPVERWNLPGVTSAQQLWFMGTPEIDTLINQKFRTTLEQATVGRLDHWMQSPEGALALLLLLDQFAMNVFRDQPRSFTVSHLALPYALEAIGKGFDQKVPPVQRIFFYLPLEHAEDIHLQNRSLELFKALIDAGEESEREMFEMTYDYAVRHHRVIERFGRYPDRNPILGRDPTPEEQKYMDDGGPDF
jgi:uncharacterized protein (DUF924 family)